MPISARKQQTVDSILSLAGMTNPYNRSGANSKSEYYIYQMGYLASYLASLCEEDPFVYRKFKTHCEEQLERKRRKTSRLGGTAQ